jgi:hypothetical protein
MAACFGRDKHTEWVKFLEVSLRLTEVEVLGRIFGCFAALYPIVDELQYDDL